MKNAVLNHALFDAAVKAMPDDALSDLRRSAAERFKLKGFPKLHDEDWRYTNLAPVISLSNKWLSIADKSQPSPIEFDTSILQDIDAHWIVLQNGLFNIDSIALPEGVSISRLSTDAREIDKDATNIAINDAMMQLNAALLTDGLKVSIAAGITVTKPIGFLIADSSSEQAAVVQTRIIIDVHAGAAAKFIEAHTSTGDGERFANSVVQIELADRSSVDYLRIQQRARQHMQTGKLTASINEGAELRHCAFDFGGALIRNDVVVQLQGRHSGIKLGGLYLAGDSQHIDNHTRVDHCVGPTQSTEEYRGILNRKSRCVFNGKVVVHKGADGTDAQQSNHNLLLSGDAEIDTKPELEIYADDVKCAHGATVGQLDETALFYLRSRGLDEVTATQLLTRAFAADILKMMTVPEAFEYVSSAIDTRLDTLIEATCNE